MPKPNIEFSLTAQFAEMRKQAEHMMEESTGCRMILVPIDLADALETVGLITKSESGSRYLGKEIMAEWHEDHSNLVAVANMLYDEGADSQELLNFFEKPWNYSEAWDNYNAKRESEGDANVNT